MKKSIALAALLTLSIPFGQAAAAEGPSTYRVTGEDRYETSANLAYEGWEKSKVAVIATGRDFPDALSATPLAYKYDAPLLLTNTNSVPESLQYAIEDLGVTQVYLIGGTAVISADVEKQLKALGVKKITRISGSDRYQTSVKIAEAVGPSEGIFVAAGQSFADALSIAPIAAQLETPILLTKKNDVPKSVASYVNTLKPEGTLVVGGEGAISKSVASKFPNVDRISGVDRYDTNSQIVTEFAELGILDMDLPFIATGQNFPDALSASAVAAGFLNGVILTHPTTPKATTKATIKKYAKDAEEYIIVGGQKALPDSAINKLLSK
ncbi:cell wall-binding repeat-containing protein [Jeotgalibacillus sp. S-D1]|uniref:cell wall-binding repeat-containing protein n=1 Tax=Jeotgalibacillus sp. S-D1 TaxID=2552189 RepID=UPI00105A5890|nr:cell wall-binding repeat-containing protein [Jeotgalibacillus sp. S-D1]TDL31742.1 cell wall-binding repeat-containing protein [Jeotgalibacillus sp. S-D1]